MEPAEMDRYAKQLETQNKGLQAQYDQLVEKRRDIVKPGKDGEPVQSDELKKIDEQTQKTKEALVEAHGARTRLKEFKAGRIVAPDDTDKDYEALKGLRGQLSQTEDVFKNFKGTAAEGRDILKKYDDEAQRRTRLIKESFEDLQKDVTEHVRKTNESVSDAGEKWNDAFKEAKTAPGEASSAFYGFAKAIETGIVTSAEKFKGKMGELSDFLQTAISTNKSAKEIEALGDGIKKFGEDGIKEFENLASKAKSALDSLKSKLQSVNEEIKKTKEKADTERYDDSKRAANARAAVTMKRYTDEEKYLYRKKEIEEKLRFANQLAASGEEEDLKRAQGLRRDAISAAQQLGEVKKKVNVFDPKQGKRVKKDVVSISAEQAESDALAYIDRAAADLEATTNQMEDVKLVKLQTQAAELNDQIKKMEDLRNQAKELAKTLREQMKVNVDDSDAQKRLKELERDRHTRLIVDIEKREKDTKKKDILGALAPQEEGASAPTQLAGGGQLSGYGGGDTVPAMLEPGEFVMRKEAVKSYGSNFMHAINQLKARVGGFMSGGLVGFMPQLAFAGGGPVQRVVNYAVEIEIGLSGAAEKVLDRMDNLSQTFRDVAGERINAARKNDARKSYMMNPWESKVETLEQYIKNLESLLKGGKLSDFDYVTARMGAEYEKEKAVRERQDEYKNNAEMDRWTTQSQSSDIPFGPKYKDNDSGDLMRYMDEQKEYAERKRWRELHPDQAEGGMFINTGGPSASSDEGAASRQAPINMTINVNKDGKAAFSTGGNYNAWG